MLLGESKRNVGMGAGRSCEAVDRGVELAGDEFVGEGVVRDKEGVRRGGRGLRALRWRILSSGDIYISISPYIL